VEGGEGRGYWGGFEWGREEGILLGGWPSFSLRGGWQALEGGGKRRPRFGEIGQGKKDLGVKSKCHTPVRQEGAKGSKHLFIGWEGSSVIRSSSARAFFWRWNRRKSEPVKGPATRESSIVGSICRCGVAFSYGTKQLGDVDLGRETKVDVKVVNCDNCNPVLPRTIQFNIQAQDPGVTGRKERSHSSAAKGGVS